MKTAVTDAGKMRRLSGCILEKKVSRHARWHSRTRIYKAISVSNVPKGNILLFYCRILHGLVLWHGESAIENGWFEESCWIENLLTFVNFNYWLVSNIYTQSQSVLNVFHDNSIYSVATRFLDLSWHFGLVSASQVVRMPSWTIEVPNR